MTELLTIDEAAAALRVSPKTIRGWRYRQSKGQSAPRLDFRRYGGAVRVTASSVAVVAGDAVGENVGTGRYFRFPGTESEAR